MSTQVDMRQNISHVSEPNVMTHEKNSLMILVFKDHQRNMHMVHQVAQEARTIGSEVILVKMVPVQHMGMRGTEWGYLSLTESEINQIESHEATLEDYGLAYSHIFYQYMDLRDALVDVSDFVNAQVVYLHLEKSKIPLWSALVRWYLNMRFAARERKLIDLNTKLIAAN